MSSNSETPSDGGKPAASDEVPLHDLDALLEAEDPGFTKALEEVRNVEIDKSIEIEATITDPDEVDGDVREDSSESGQAKWRPRVRALWVAWKVRQKARLIQAARGALAFLKTRPKEYARYAWALTKTAAKRSMEPWRAFSGADRATKAMVAIFAAMVAAGVWILTANLKGVWIPRLSEPIIRRNSDKADWVETSDPKDGVESFHSAFPQERIEFLFRKFKVNLRRGPENPNPMGAFELLVSVDSKDTGIEVRDREVELFDLLQRVFEDETFVDLETETGKNKLKSRIKKEINQKLTQGWVRDVSFKTFILKP